MKYVANPVEVEANKIVSVGVTPEGAHLALENGENVTMPPEITQIIPQPGDYHVVHADGAIGIYIEEWFKRDYSPAPAAQHPSE